MGDFGWQAIWINESRKIFYQTDKLKDVPHKNCEKVEGHISKLTKIRNEYEKNGYRKTDADEFAPYRGEESVEHHLKPLLIYENDK